MRQLPRLFCVCLSLILVPLSISSAQEEAAGWNEEFHNPEKGLVQPTLGDAQVCLSYMVQKAQDPEFYAPVMDEFCALRGLYLNETG